MAKVTVEQIEAAHHRIAPHVLRTPLVAARSLSRVLGQDISLKLEILQETGSFKLRGATNAMLALDPADRNRGVVTASSGNHGPALACAASRLGAPATICLSEMVPRNKVENVRANGGNPHIAGRDYDQSMALCMDLVSTRNLTLVHPFDDPNVVAGAGAIGLELIEDDPELDCILVPLSGGGLMAGVATAVKARAAHVRVIGVTMENGAAMYRSLQAGAPVEVDEVETIADALGGGIGLDNRWTFEAVRDLTDDCVLVSDEQIKDAMRLVFRTEGLMVEGAGAVGIAALMSGAVIPAGRVACVLSGRNIAPEKFLNIIQEQKPGNLAPPPPG